MDQNQKKSRIQGVTSKEYNGIKYRSTLEANTAEMFDRLGIPFEYETKKITLLEGFHSPFQKEKVRAIHYTPDFIIKNSIIIECKGFATPEWNNKKKYIFKYLMEKEPGTCFYEIHNCKGELLQALDKNWSYLGYAIRVTRKPKRTDTSMSTLYSSIEEAFKGLNLEGRSYGPLMKSFLGEASYVYGYNWKIVKINL